MIALLLATLASYTAVGAEPATTPAKPPAKTYRNPLLPDREIANPSKSPTGPFVKYAGNPIAHRGGDVLGPGHHCIVEGPEGKLWLVYHQKWNAEQNFHRFLAIDPIWFDGDGVLHTKTSRGSDEPAP